MVAQFSGFDSSRLWMYSPPDVEILLVIDSVERNIPGLPADSARSSPLSRHSLDDSAERSLERPLRGIQRPRSVRYAPCSDVCRPTL